MKQILAARRRFIRFAIVGLGATLLLFTLTYVFSRLGMQAFLAGLVAYAIAFLMAYAGQRVWTFGGSHDHSHAFPRYLAAQLGCATASALVGHICFEVFASSPFWTSAAVTATSGVMSYLLSSRWVFAGGSQSARS